MIKIYRDFSFNLKSPEFAEYPKEKIEEIRKDIANGNVVILKDFFSKKSLIELREAIFKLFCDSNFSNPELNHNTLNFIRRDENPAKSAVKRTKQFYVSFYWNKPLFGEREKFLSLTHLRGKIARLPLGYTVNGIEQDGYLTYPNITHYPIGGGMLNKHTDPPNKQFCTIMAAMSERGRDFKNGGIYFYNNDKKVDLESHLSIGDVYLMNPSIPHGVDKIYDLKESNSEINWELNKGRWILFPALIEATSLSGIKPIGLKDLENLND